LIEIFDRAFDPDLVIISGGSFGIDRWSCGPLIAAASASGRQGSS